MLGQEFMRNALLAGTFIALACGVSGWFVVLRGQVFAGDALSHVAFPGALAAAAAGIDERVGLFAATIVVGARRSACSGAAARAPRGGRVALGRRRGDDTAIGTVFTFILGLGVFFLTRLSTSSAGGSGIQGAHTLFGSIFGLSGGEARLRRRSSPRRRWWRWRSPARCCSPRSPPRWRRARGVPTRLLGDRLRGAARGGRRRGHAGGRGAAAARAAGRSGGRRAPPAARAPFGGHRARGGLAVVAMWGGLALAYAIPSLPPSTAIVTIAVGIYYVAAPWRSGRGRRGGVRRRRAAPQVARDAAEREHGDDEQHRAGVLGERADDARGEAAGERGEPRRDRRRPGASSAPAQAHARRRRQRQRRRDGHRVVLQLVPGGVVAAHDHVAQVAGRARVQDAAGVVAGAVRGREVERGERHERDERADQHEQRAPARDGAGEQHHGRHGEAGADEDHAADAGADPRGALDRREHDARERRSQAPLRRGARRERARRRAPRARARPAPDLSSLPKP